MAEIDEKAFLEQFESERKQAEDQLKVKIDTWRSWLKLYLNQRKDKDAIGDNTLYSIMNTLLASVQADSLNVEFLGREYGDRQQADNLNNLAEYDYEKMDKFSIDYQWNWWSFFCGRTICLQREFDREEMLPMPDLFDPFVTYIDPSAETLNGRGEARFFGRAISLTKREAENRGYENIDMLEKCGESDLIEQNNQSKSEAFGITYAKDAVVGENKVFHVIEWYTWHNGKRMFFVIGMDGKTVFKKQVLKQQDRWCATDRCPLPIAGDFFGVTIPDLTEDKQRAMANLKNLMYQAVELDTYPRFMYNGIKIPNESDLNISFNRHIEIDGDINGAIAPIQPRGIGGSSQYMLDVISNDADKASATPDVRQGVQQNKVRSATEITQVLGGSDDRYGLIIKMIIRSDIDFWRQWYSLYKLYFSKKIDKKVIRLEGEFGTEWRKLTKDQIEMSHDPDIKIVSKVQSENKNRQELNSLSYLISNVPEINKRQVSIEILRKSGIKPSDISRFFPPTQDELEAESQNDKLSRNINIDANLEDDHETFIRINSRAAETEARKRKIRQHWEFLRLKKTNPDLFPDFQPQEEVQQNGNQTQPLNFDTTAEPLTNQ